MTNDKGAPFLSACTIPGTSAPCSLPRLPPGPCTTRLSPLCPHLPRCPRLAPLHPPGLSRLLGLESHQVQADLRASAVAVTSSQNALPPRLVAEVGFRSLVWCHLLIRVSPAFCPLCRHSIPGLCSMAHSSTGKQVTILVTGQVSADTVWALPSVNGMSEPHITLHSHCNPIKYGKALIFQGARGSSPAGPTLLLHGSGRPGLPSTCAVPSAWEPPAPPTLSCPPGVCSGCHNRALQIGGSTAQVSLLGALEAGAKVEAGLVPSVGGKEVCVPHLSPSF